MSKVTDILNNQVDNKDSFLNNLLNGKPIATTEFGLETGTIIKLSLGLFTLGVCLMLFYKAVVQKK
jgi:hypothetical protein